MQYILWLLQGKPIPANDYVKQLIVKTGFKKSRHTTFVETGTLLGRMTGTLSSVAKTIFSIELNPDYVINARTVFACKKHINIIEGDSANELGKLLQTLTEPAFFWLDAHYSGGTTARADKDTPIVKELEHILTHPIKTHTVWIDDMRCFDGTHDYPTIDTISELVKEFYTAKPTDFDVIILSPK